MKQRHHASVRWCLVWSTVRFSVYLMRHFLIWNHHFAVCSCKTTLNTDMFESVYWKFFQYWKWSIEKSLFLYKWWNGGIMLATVLNIFIPVVCSLEYYQVFCVFDEMFPDFKSSFCSFCINCLSKFLSDIIKHWYVWEFWRKSADFTVLMYRHSFSHLVFSLSRRR